ncbi:hypothetical protein [Aeromicrobium chenweiae]|uniref:hypothetical protein n=1 Tax=Aeromicrobium chenweiae TaxID=2079793 RepID=UPI0010924A2A|nr:hypothetical protein [Aeromicrobium chenweiae]TGN32972.1 hypothetical protein E4L97_09850 [Aeromicrobium chenweiae]
MWIVFLGTGAGQETLTVAAITGSRQQAEAMLEHGARALPDRSNEWGSFRFTPCSTSADGRGEVAHVPAIALGERRTVYVWIGEENWIEVFGCWKDANDQTQEMLRRGRPEAQVFSAVTNTWVGIVGDDPRLRTIP